jgi:hypothetical protein
MESYKVLARVNAVFPTQEEMDRVGVEPTSSAMPATLYLRTAMEREIHTVQIKMTHYLKPI